MSSTAPIPDPHVYRTCVVARATYAVFHPGSDAAFDRVGSRCLLWCIAGTGAIVSGGRRIEMARGSVVVLPWGHDIRYDPGPGETFITGCVHLLPWHDPELPILRRVPHVEGDPTWLRTDRGDVPWPGYESARSVSGPTASRVAKLGEAAVEYALGGGEDAHVLRALGTVIAQALLEPSAAADLDRPAPPYVQSAQLFALEYLGGSLATEELARLVGCSRSALERQFRRHTGESVQGWVRGARMDRAALLLRSTTLRVAEVARAVGYTDAFHFSRTFRARFGVPPVDYRRGEILH